MDRPGLIELANIHHVRGHSFAVQRADVSEGDTNQEPRRSTLEIFENDRSLGPPHALHDTIADIGQGRYSHWWDTIYFSSSDNSDPRKNGRKYYARMQAMAPVLKASSPPPLDEAAAIDRMFGIPLSAGIAIDTPSARACRDALRALALRIVILAPSRSGSEYFSHMLRDVGIDSEEFLTVGSSVSAARAMPEGADEATFISDVCRQAPNRIFCTMEGAHRLLPLFRVGEFAEHLRDWHFIHLVRRNIVRQAISLIRAERDGQYRAEMPKTGTATAPITFSDIAACIDRLYISRQRIERFIELFGVNALTIYYEDLLSSPARTMRDVTNFLDLTHSNFAPLGQGSKPRPEKQSDQVSDDLETAFRAELVRRLKNSGMKTEILLSVAAS